MLFCVVLSLIGLSLSLQDERVPPVASSLQRPNLLPMWNAATVFHTALWKKLILELGMHLVLLQLVLLHLVLLQLVLLQLVLARAPRICLTCLFLKIHLRHRRPPIAPAH